MHATALVTLPGISEKRAKPDTRSVCSVLSLVCNTHLCQICAEKAHK